MARKPLPTLLLITIGLLVSGTATQAAPTLAEALEATFERTRQMPLARALENESRAIREQADSLVAGDPSVTLANINDRLGNDNGYAEWELGVELPLWLPGQRDARRAVADATASQAGALSTALRLGVAGELREAAWEEALTAARLRMARTALDSAHGLEQTVARRVRAGEVARVDLLLAQQETLGAETALQEADAAHARSLSNLRLLTGLDQPPSPLTEVRPTELDLGDDHPRLRLAAMATGRARAGRDQVLTERREAPILGLGGKRQRDRRGQDYEDLLTLQLTLPLGISSQAAPRQAEAERQLTETQVEQVKTRRELESGLAAARLALTAGAEATTLAERRQLLAADALRLSQRAFELGESGVLPLIQAHRRSLEADLDLELRRLEQGRSLARLNQALGRLPD